MAGVAVETESPEMEAIWELEVRRTDVFIGPVGIFHITGFGSNIKQPWGQHVEVAELDKTIKNEKFQMIDYK